MEKIPKKVRPEWLIRIMYNTYNISAPWLCREAFPAGTILILAKSNGEIGEYIVRDCDSASKFRPDRSTTEHYEFVISAYKK